MAGVGWEPGQVLPGWAGALGGGPTPGPRAKSDPRPRAWHDTRFTQPRLLVVFMKSALASRSDFDLGCMPHCRTHLLAMIRQSIFAPPIIGSDSTELPCSIDETDAPAVTVTSGAGLSDSFPRRMRRTSGSPLSMCAHMQGTDMQV